MSKDLTEALRNLTENGSSETNVVQAPKQRGAVPAQTSAAPLTSVPGSGPGGSGGAAGDLTESAYSDRAWHEEVTLTSTDGLFAIKVKPIKSIKLASANGVSVTYTFKAPK